MYNVTREAHSRISCCHCKAISIRYSCVCVCSLRYPSCPAQAPHYIATYGLSTSTKFPHIISQTAQFSGEKKVLHINIFFLSLQISCEAFPILQRTRRDILIIYTCIHVKYPLSCQIMSKLANSRQILRNY